MMTRENRGIEIISFIDKMLENNEDCVRFKSLKEVANHFKPEDKIFYKFIHNLPYCDIKRSSVIKYLDELSLFDNSYPKDSIPIIKDFVHTIKPLHDKFIYLYKTSNNTMYIIRTNSLMKIKRSNGGFYKIRIGLANGRVTANKRYLWLYISNDSFSGMTVKNNEGE